jgi:hypothetical protein
MATLQSGYSPGTRIDTGDSVISASASVNTKSIAKRLGAFKTAHAAYRAADAQVKKAMDALQKQQAKVAEADVDQDDAVNELATELPRDGLPRVNPFKPFGAPAPSVLCGMGYSDEAQAVLRLEKAVLKRKGLSSGSIAAAKNGAACAKKVLAALAPIAKLEKSRSEAITRRDALAQTWETAFAALKRGARYAEDDGAAGLYAALFDRPAKPSGKKKAKPAPKEESAPPA